MWRNLCKSLLHFLVRVQCRRKESSRSLSHLLMSFLCLHVEREKTGDEDKKLEFTGKVFKGCCFALNQDESDADEGIASYLSGVCGFARMMTGDGGSTEKSPRTERNSPAPRSRDGVASATRPGDVLTDVLLRLTFDNTAYVEEACDDAEASGLLPDKRSGNTPST